MRLIPIAELEPPWGSVFQRMMEPISGHATETILLRHEAWILQGVIYLKWHQRVAINPINSTPIPSISPPISPQIPQLEVDRYAALWYQVLNLVQASFELSAQNYYHPCHWFSQLWLEGHLLGRFTDTEAKNLFITRLHHQNQHLDQLKNPFDLATAPHSQRLIASSLKWKPWLIKPYQRMVIERKAWVKYLRRHEPCLFRVGAIDKVTGRYSHGKELSSTTFWTGLRQKLNLAPPPPSSPKLQPPKPQRFTRSRQQNS
jgi:hypothetical protein